MDSPIPAQRLIRRDEMLALVGLTYQTVWEWTRKGHFPMPVVLSPPGSARRTLAWRADEIAAWVQTRQRGHGLPLKRVHRRFPIRGIKEQ